MGTYNDNLEWEADKMVHVIPPTEDKPARVGWVAMGMTDTEFARKFAHDLLAKCDRADAMNSVDTNN